MTFKFHPTPSYIMLKEITTPKKEDEFQFPRGLNTDSTYIMTKLNIQEKSNPRAIYQEAIGTIQIFISLLQYPRFNPDV